MSPRASAASVSACRGVPRERLALPGACCRLLLAVLALAPLPARGAVRLFDPHRLRAFIDQQGRRLASRYAPAVIDQLPGVPKAD